MSIFNDAKEVLLNTYGYLPVVFSHGNESTLYGEDGKEYIDFTSGIGVNCLGYNDADWTKAVSTAASTLQHNSNIFLNKNTVELAKKLVSISNMSKVFFANSGAEANEGAIKLARKYSYMKYGNDRNVILSLKQSFHGRTLAALTATGQDKFHNYFFPFPQGFDYVEANNIEEFKEKATNNVCAIIMESIQGEGGVNQLDKDFVKQVVTYCNDNDIVVIFDEVQCGIARTGSLFGFDVFNIKADIITMAKGLGGGLPIAGFLCNEKLSEVFVPGDHGTTYGGNPVASAGALVVLNKICNEDFYKQVTEKGLYIKNKLKEANITGVIDIRGNGLMIGIETTKDLKEIQSKALNNGLLVLTAGKNVIRLLPPLTISYKDIDKGLSILIDAL
ncbi:MAG: aspartate aminotransferase family protein [Clostridium sp.]|uniref:aspartate aminotransferase family protein n=1 Tax=Clostridium sp. TaxID=1506 RepID=UPI003028B1FB